MKIAQYLQHIVFNYIFFQYHVFETICSELNSKVHKDLDVQKVGLKYHVFRINPMQK